MDTLTKRVAEFLDSQFVRVSGGILQISESNPSGLGNATFTTGGGSILITTNNKTMVQFLACKKAADGAIITSDDENSFNLHLIELKSKLTIKEWEKSIEQYKGLFLSIHSILSVLGIKNIKSIKCYIAYKSDHIDLSEVRDPVLFKALDTNPLYMWIKEEVKLPFDLTANLVKGERYKRGINIDAYDFDFGTIL